MRILLSLLFLLLPFYAHAACEGRDLRDEMTQEQQAELAKAMEGLLYPEGNHWIATRDDTVLHLIGTMHSNDSRMDAVTARMAQTIATADAIYFEVTQAQMDAFEQSLAKDPSPVLITSGPTLVDLIPQDDWAALSAGLADRGVPAWMAAKMQPWFLSMMLAIPPCMVQDPKADYGMDARLAEIAQKNGVAEHSLETVEDLIDIFQTHSIEKQAQSLARMVPALEASEDQITTLANAYMEEKHGLILQLARLQGKATSELPAQIFEEEWAEFEQQLLVTRNANWMERILAIQDQTAVIAVGAGHFAGSYGLLHQLQQAGYSLNRAAF